jgi:predicted amidohydrolase
MKSKLKVACVQTNSSDLPAENIEMLENIFVLLSRKSPDLICLPECVSIFTDSEKKIKDYVKNSHHIFLKFIKDKAKQLKTFILVGSFPKLKNNNKYFNRSILINEIGKEVCFYDKINLFDVTLEKNESYVESKNYDPGKRIKLVELPWGQLGMSICYDLRFPLLYKKLARKGAIFFSIPAAFTYTTGKAHWHALIRARAIENGCYVFAAAQCGKHKNGRRTYGHSLIVDPWGNIISEADEKIGFICAVIDTEVVETVRKKIPSTISYDL